MDVFKSLWPVLPLVLVSSLGCAETRLPVDSAGGRDIPHRTQIFKLGFERGSLAAFNIDGVARLPCFEGPIRLDLLRPLGSEQLGAVRLSGKPVEGSVTLGEIGRYRFEFDVKQPDGSARTYERWVVVGKKGMTRAYPIADKVGLFETDLRRLKPIRTPTERFRTSTTRKLLANSAYLYGDLVAVQDRDRIVDSPLVFAGSRVDGNFTGGHSSNWRVLSGTFAVPRGVTIIDNLRRVLRIEDLCADPDSNQDDSEPDPMPVVRKSIDIPLPNELEEIEQPPQETPAIGIVPADFSISPGGAAQYVIPIRIPPGRAGMQPDLSIVYTSGHRDSFLGTGFQLTGLSSIIRCTRQLGADGELRPVDYSDADRFCLDGVRLVVVSGDYGTDGTEYRTEEESFARITSQRSSNAPEPDSFVVETRTGEIRLYGRTEGCAPLPTNSENPCDGVTMTRHGRSSEWRLKQVRDRYGNAIHYEYELLMHRPGGVGPGYEAYEVVPAAIRYTAHIPSGLAPRRSVEFAYIDRAAPVSSYLSGRLVRKSRLLSSIRTVVDGATVTEYRFQYDQLAHGRVMMISVSECTGANVCKPPTEFEWSRREAGFGDPITLPYAYPLQWENRTVISLHDYLPHQPPLTMDVDGNGTDDLVFQNHENWKIIFSSPGPMTTGSFSLVETGEPAWAYKKIIRHFLGPDEEFADYSFNSHGLPLDYNSDNHVDLFLPGMGQFLLSTGSGFQRHFIFGDQHEVLMPTPQHFPARAFAADLNRDGLKDYLHCAMGEPINAAAQLQWRYQFHEGEGFGEIRLLTDALEGRYRDCGSADVRVMDINGDGAVEILMALQNDGEFKAVDFTTHPPTVRQSGLPNKTFANARGGQTRLTDKIIDINGDGLADVLMVRPDDPAIPGFDGGQVRAWINTGTGFIGGNDGLPAIEGDESHYSLLLSHSRSFDFDGDGMKDLFIAQPDDPDHPDGPGRWKILKATGALSDFENLADNSFAFVDVGWPTFPYEGGDVRRQLFADLNGDHVPDLIHGEITSYGPPAMAVFVVREGRGKPFFGITRIREGKAGLLSGAPDYDNVWTYEIEYGP